MFEYKCFFVYLQEIFVFSFSTVFYQLKILILITII